MKLEDSKIIDLFFLREERAIRETKSKYENYLYKISKNILNDKRDCEESLNDTYLQAWNRIPPTRPNSLKLFLGKITRGISIDIYRKKTSKKRKDSQYILSINELDQVIGFEENPLEDYEYQKLIEIINQFLEEESQINRQIFVCRYFFFDSIRDIGNYVGLKEGNVKVKLHRLRKRLDQILKEEGY